MSARPIATWRARIRALLRRGAVERDLDAEIAYHLERETEKHIASGLSPADARARARAAFGSIDVTREAHRDGRGTRWIEDFFADVRYALRTLGRARALTTAAIVTLALGIGANTAIFSAVSAVMLTPLPFAEPDRLVKLWESNPEFGWVNQTAAPANMLDWRDQVSSFAGVVAHTKFGDQITLTGRGEPKLFTVESVTGDFFRVLGVRMALGTTFRDEETWRTSENNVVLSHGAWQREFGGDRELVGRTITLNDQEARVVGVLPVDFAMPGMTVDVWRPFAWNPAQRTQVSFRRAHWMETIARLKPGVTHAAANAELQGVITRLQTEYPETNRVMGGGMTPLHEFLIGDARTPLLVLLGAVAVLLLIACANVGNLLLVRASGRAQETAVRLALGARRSRLTRAAITESLVLSSLGGAAGLLLGWWGTRALSVLRPENLLPAGDIVINWQVLAYVVAITTLSGLAFGIAPAMASGRHAPSAAMREGGRTGSGGRRARRWGEALVVAEVGLALALTLGAGLLVKTMWNLQRVAPGMDTSGVYTASITLPAARYAEAAHVFDFWDRFTERVEAIPGVTAASFVSRLPLTGQPWSSEFTVDGWPPERFGSQVVHREVDPKYFAVMRVPLVRGRLLDATDRTDSERVAVVNEALVAQYFNGEDPIGRRIVFDRAPAANAIWRTIVGVVGSERQAGLVQDPIPEIFEPARQSIRRTMVFAARAQGDPAALGPSVRGVLAEIDPKLPLAEVRTMAEVRDTAGARHRFLATLLFALAAVGLVLALVGVYGVMAQVARGRAREMSIRLALGAQPREVRWLVVRRGLVLTVAGLALGLGVALVATQAMRTLLYGVEPIDPFTFAVVPALIVVAAALACWIPALRAGRGDAVATLRAE